MKKHFARLFMVATSVAPIVALAQSPIPIRTTAPAAQSPEQFGPNLSIRSLPNGKALVHDIAHKRMVVFDSLMSNLTVTVDSEGTTGSKYPNSYGGTQLIPYLADSTLYPDMEAKTFMVFDPNGRFAHATAHPNARDLSAFMLQNPGVEGTDREGRLIYRSISGPAIPKLKTGEEPPIRTRDTISIVRADFNKRIVDTVASFTAVHNQDINLHVDADGKRTAVRTINPLPIGPDDWGVMTDGTIAVIRSHDYHVDLTFPDGRTVVGAKLPFDWRRLSDDDKQRRVDSTKRVIDSLVSLGKYRSGKIIFSIQGAPGEASRIDSLTPTVAYSPITDMADYIPPFRAGALKPDADNNVWILPTTSASANGGLLYDVINNKGELFERVQLPADRFVVGFGKGRVVYVAHYDRPGKFYTLERTRVVH